MVGPDLASRVLDTVIAAEGAVVACIADLETRMTLAFLSSKEKGSVAKGYAMGSTDSCYMDSMVGGKQAPSNDHLEEEASILRRVA